MVGQRSAPLSGAKILKALMVALVSLVLCAVVVPRATAWADETVGSIDVTLTVVAGESYDASAYCLTHDVWVNKTYTLPEGSTAKDLLDAAVVKGDLGGYTIPNGYIGAITNADGSTTLTNSSDYAEYWCHLKNCSVNDGSMTLPTNILSDGDTYQLVWTVGSSTVKNRAAGPLSTSDGLTALYSTEGYFPEDVAGDGEMSVTFTMVAGDSYSTDTWQLLPDAWVNKVYMMPEGSTVEDLLSAAAADAGFSYTMNSGYVNTVTLNGVTVGAADDWSNFWSTYYDFAWASQSAADTELYDGFTYTLVYTCSDMTVKNRAVDSFFNLEGAWDTFYAAQEPTEGGAYNPNEGGSESSDAPSELNDEKLNALYNNVIASYANTTSEVQALILAAADERDTVNLDELKKLCVSYVENPSAANLQKAVLVLTAYGIDPTAVTVDGQTYDLVDEMGQAYGEKSAINTKIFMLMAYASGPYEPTSGMTIDQLLDDVLAAELADGGFAFSGTSIDVDITAMTLTALAEYRDGRPEVQSAIDSSLKALRAIQNEDGGFASPWGGKPQSSNANSTASVVTALCALGVSPWSSDWSKDGATPISNLLTFATSDNAGFTYTGSGSVNKMATSDGIRALVAYKQLAETDEAFNAYIPGAKEQALTGEWEWDKDASAWRYRYSDGSFAVDTWLQDQGLWYHFDADGVMQTGWIRVSEDITGKETLGNDALGAWYKLNGSGALIKGSWEKDSVGWCLLDEETGEMKFDCWTRDSVAPCYIGHSGYCLTGWFVADTDVNGAETPGAWYNADESGRVMLGAWVKDSVGWCYTDAETGQMVTNGWAKDSSGPCYLGADGYCKTGWFVADTDINGAETPGAWYHANSAGQVDCGKWMKDSVGWCYLDPETGAMWTNAWVKDSAGWCFVGADGYCVAGGDFEIQTTEGQSGNPGEGTFLFDQNGNMLGEVK